MSDNPCYDCPQEETCEAACEDLKTWRRSRHQKSEEFAEKVDMSGYSRRKRRHNPWKSDWSKPIE